MTPRRLRPSLLLALTSLASILALSPLFSEAQTPKRGGTLRVSYGNEISNLDFYTAPGYELNWVAKVSWMNVATQDGPFDMYVEDLASLFTLYQNTLLSHSTAAWNTTRHTDPKVDDYYARYAREMDPAKRKAIAREFQEFTTDKLYWNTISGSPFYEVAQPWMKDYVYNAEWKVLYKKVWLDR